MIFFLGSNLWTRRQEAMQWDSHFRHRSVSGRRWWRLSQSRSKAKQKTHDFQLRIRQTSTHKKRLIETQTSHSFPTFASHETKNTIDNSLSHAVQGKLNINLFLFSFGTTCRTQLRGSRRRNRRGRKRNVHDKQLIDRSVRHRGRAHKHGFQIGQSEEHNSFCQENLRSSSHIVRKQLSCLFGLFNFCWGK